MPMVPSANPNSTIRADFSAFLPVRFVRMINPSTHTAKYSGERKDSARSAILSAVKVSATMPMVPAIKEPQALMANAAPARPFFAMALPSRQVTTLAASPGRFTRMDVVEPPYIAP